MAGFDDLQRSARETFPLSADEMARVAACRHGDDIQRALARSRVGVAGLGGLGSNVAMQLARLGVGALVLVDFDVVEPSNLNRQQYFARQLGRPKALVLAESLLEVNPHLCYEPHVARVDAANVIDLFGGCDVVVEAVDDPVQKASVTEAVLTRLPQTALVGASGMAGVGSGNDVRTERRFGSFYVCGDGTSDVAEEGYLAAPRVALAASHQALMVLRLLTGREEP